MLDKCRSNVLETGSLLLTQPNNFPTISLIYAVPPSSPIVNIDHQKMGGTGKFVGAGTPL